MGGLADFLAWQASNSANKVSSVPTAYVPMNAADFQKNNDGSLDDMNRRALDSSNNVLLRTGLDVATSLGKDPKDTKGG